MQVERKGGKQGVPKATGKTCGDLWLDIYTEWLLLQILQGREETVFPLKEANFSGSVSEHLNHIDGKFT